VKIAHINNTSGVPSAIARQQNKENHVSEVFLFNKFHFKAFGGRKFNYYSPFSRWKFFKAISEFELWHYHHPYGSLKKSLEKRKANRLFIKHYHGQELRQEKTDFDFCLVSTPDLLKYAPNGKWLPSPVDMDLIKSIPIDNREPKDGKLRIGYYAKIHEKWIGALELRKQSTLNELKLANRCSLLPINNLSHRDTLKLISKCDIIVGKILPSIGWFGRIELEAMAFGRPVIANVSDELYEKYKPPIHRTTPDNFKQDLEYLMDDSNYRRQLGKSGSLYVTENHSPKRVTTQLDKWYEKLT
jgi:hypothetical protein